MRYPSWRIPAYGAEQQPLVMVLGNLLANNKSRWLHMRRGTAGEDTSAQAA